MLHAMQCPKEMKVESKSANKTLTVRPGNIRFLLGPQYNRRRLRSTPKYHVDTATIDYVVETSYRDTYTKLIVPDDLPFQDASPQTCSLRSHTVALCSMQPPNLCDGRKFSSSGLPLSWLISVASNGSGAIERTIERILRNLLYIPVLFAECPRLYTAFITL